MTSERRETIFESLQNTKLLRDAPEEAVREVARRARYQSVKADEIVFLKQDAASSLYLLEEGRIRMSTIDRRGVELLLGMVEVGELFGELGLVVGSRRVVTAVADQDSRVLVIHRRDVWPILEKSPVSAMALARILAGHLRVTVDKLESVALHDAERRLWSRLVSLGRRYGRTGSVPESLRVEHGLSQQKLANSVGLTRVMVSRQLGRWRDKDLVAYGRGYVEIRDPEALEAIVWQSPRIEPEAAE